MAKLLSTIKRFIGESGEHKATDCQNGSTFLEMDTGDMYAFKEGSWTLKDEAGITTRIHIEYLLTELLEQAKKTNEFLKLTAEALND